MKKPILIFDHDGTLHDSMHIFAPAVHIAEDWVREQGYDIKTVDDSVISSCLGLNRYDMWGTFGYDADEVILEEMADYVDLQVGRLLKTGCAKWFEGTEAMLDALMAQGVSMVILSNCEKSLADFYWNHFRMEKWFDKFYECESYNFAPKTEIIKIVLEEYKNTGIMIGDRYTDFDCARAAQIPFLACGFGFAAEGELDGADAVADTVGDIPRKIKELMKRMDKK